MYLNFLTKSPISSSLWLTLTWDVFKSRTSYYGYIKLWRLTLTWDVFKCLKIGQLLKDKSRLTLTWDVFK